MTGDLIKQGAEARLYLGEFNGQQCLVKERFIKKYRHPELDAQITKERMRAESKAISRCSAIGIKTPKIFNMDLKSRKIYMEYFPKSKTVKDYVQAHLTSKMDTSSSKDDQLLNRLCDGIGSIIGKMHSNNIIHGDLTTSNILVNPMTGSDDSFEEYELIFIDFGLSQYSQNTEEKGVDLYVLERALISTHSDLPEFFTKILESYKNANEKSSKEVISKFEEVRARGRKRTMVG